MDPQIKAWLGQCACVVETGLLHSIGQANQKAVLSIASMPKHAIAKEVEGHTLGKIFKITCFDIRYEDIFKHIYLYG